MLLSEDIAAEVTGVCRVLDEDVLQVQTRSDESVGSMCRLGVVIPRHDHRVLSPSLLHELEDFKHLAVSVTRIKLLQYYI